jgi:deazaflavin-dependent oxidoreductase (nitroreductase family)
MAKAYRYDLLAKLSNIPFRWLGARGLGAEHRHVLTVRGRVSGRRHSTPVEVMTRDGQRYLVAGYGVTNWVPNARVAGVVELDRGGHRQGFGSRELDPDEAAPVLRQYVEAVPVIRDYFNPSPSDPTAAFETEVLRHPVFELITARPEWTPARSVSPTRTRGRVHPCG